VRGTLNIKAGVDKNGRLLDPQARVYFQTAQEYERYAESLYKDNGLWYQQQDRGHESVISAYNQINSKGLNISSTGGVIADVGVNAERGETLQTVVGKLSLQPSMEWLGQLQQRPDVDWNAVNNAFQDWDYQKEGLTPQAAALISIVIGMATGGVTSAWSGKLAGLLGQSAGGVLSTALQTGMSQLLKQGGVALINNKGDLGKTFKALGSSASFKALASSMITAGLSSKLSSTLHLNGNPSQLNALQQLESKALNGLVSATVSSAIEGTAFDDQLKSSLKLAVVDTLNQMGAKTVGDLLGSGQYGYLAHKIAHAALGCVAGAAANDDCASGALGGGSSSIAGESFSSEKAAVLAAAIAATLMGKDVHLAANVGGIADQFNRQLHPKEVEFLADAARIQRYIDYMKAQGVILTQEQAIQALNRYGAALVDQHWAALNGNDPATSAFILAETKQFQSSYQDSNGQSHSFFTAKPDEYKNELINLKPLFSAYGKNPEVKAFLESNFDKTRLENWVRDYQDGQKAGYADAGKNASLLRDTEILLESLIATPSYIKESLSSDEVGVYDGEQLKSYYQALLKLQGRAVEAGYYSEYEWATSQRLAILSLFAAELGGTAIGSIASKVATKVKAITPPKMLNASYKRLQSGGAAVNNSDLPTGYYRVTDSKGEIKIASPDGRVYDSVDDIPPIYSFRGTTDGFKGSSARQESESTTTSTDPLVATTYCIHHECVSGEEGIIEVYNLNKVPNSTHYTSLPEDFEVFVEFSPIVASKIKDFSITSYQASQILNDMGYSVPKKIYNPSDVQNSLKDFQLNGVTPLPANKVTEFLRRAKEISK
jgi:hypothetical protein